MPGDVADETLAEAPVGGGEPIAERAAVEAAAEAHAEQVIEGDKVPDQPLKSYKRRSGAPLSPSRPTKFQRLMKAGDIDPAPKRAPSNLEDDDVQPPAPLPNFPVAEAEVDGDEEEGGEEEEGEEEV